MSDVTILANDIVRGNHSNVESSTFHDTSFIYRKTNERLQDIRELFKNRSKIMCVIGSGDQILNACLHKPDKIVGFDISVFPTYYFKLKVAGVKGLNRQEFIDFFFDGPYTDKDEYYDDLYFDKISPYLDDKTREFWNYLFNYNDWFEICDSTLFSSEPVIPRYACVQNEYLDEDKFLILKENINDVDIELITQDILSNDYELPNDLDLLYLSNIYQYYDLIKYKEILKNLEEQMSGDIITYTFGNPEDLAGLLDNADFKSFNDNGIVVNSRCRKKC